MKEGTQLTHPQRKALIELLGEYGGVYKRAKNNYEETLDAAKDSIVLAIAKENGADQLLLQYRSLKQQAKAVETKLDEVGLDVDDKGNFSFNYHTPDSWDQRVEDELEAAFGSRKQLLDTLFETARVKLWLVTTAEEAEKIVEPLLNFEMKAK